MNRSDSQIRRVLHILNEIKFSGAEIMLANAASLLSEQGIEQFAFSTGPTIGDFEKVFARQGIKSFHKPIQYGYNPLKILRYCYDTLRFLKEQRIDILHIHRSDLYLLTALAWWANIRCIKTQHNTFRNRWFTHPYGIAQRWIARNLFGTIFHTIGESVESNELTYYRNPSVRINNWYDESKFYPATDNEKQQAREALSLDPQAFVLISTGGCSHVKNHHDILRAMSLLQGEIKCVYLHLGKGQTEEEELELAHHLGLDDQIYFLGNRENVRDYLIASDVFVMTSRFEGLSIASIEAMGCHLPSILYNSPGLRDLIHGNDNGFLIPEDPQILAEKILHLYRSPELAARQADQALKFVRRHFSMKTNVSKLIQLYEGRTID